MRNRLLRGLLVPALAGALAAPAAAVAQEPGGRQPPPSDFGQLFDEYRRQGFIYGCTHRSADLREALAAIPADINAYDPGFADALSAGLEQRSAGCKGALSSPFPQSPAEATGTILADDGSPGPGNRRSVGAEPAPEAGGASMPLALALLAGIVGAVLVGATWLWATRQRGWAGPGKGGARLQRARERIADGVWVLRDRLGL
jgi:hypothetical protein